AGGLVDVHLLPRLIRGDLPAQDLVLRRVVAPESDLIAEAVELTREEADPRARAREPARHPAPSALAKAEPREVGVGARRRVRPVLGDGVVAVEDRPEAPVAEGDPIRRVLVRDLDACAEVVEADRGVGRASGG